MINRQELQERAESIQDQISTLRMETLMTFNARDRGIHLSLLTASHAMRTVVALAGQERVERKQKDYIVKKCNYRLIEVTSDPGLKDMFERIEGIENVVTIFKNEYRLWVSEHYDLDTMLEHVENVLNIYFSGLIKKES